MADKRAFLRFLAGESGAPVLFEPFLSRRHAETLIWRRGAQLWDTAEHEIRTLISLTDRTGADAVFADLRGKGEDRARDTIDILSAARKAFPALCFGVITDDPSFARSAEDCADVLCAYGEVSSRRLPVIRMDGSPEEAIDRGDAAWFAPSCAEEWLLRFGDRIPILGGLGVDALDSPSAVYARVENLAVRWRGRWSVGSGGVIGEDNYLGLIAMLGAFGRVRGSF